MRDHAVGDQDGAGRFRPGLPGPHPFAVSPIVRAEQADLFPLQAAFDRGEKGLKFTLFQLLRAHGGAPEQQDVAFQDRRVGFRHGQDVGGGAGRLDAVGDGGRHRFGIARSGPIHHTDHKIHSFVHELSNR